jgi:lysozyme family protein
MSNFETAVALVLKHEGGFVDDKNDSGGATNWGISSRSYPNIDVAKLTRDDAIAIYRRDFWEPLRCDELPYGLAVQLFDMAVNAGVSAAVKILQSTLFVTADGVLGPVTIAAAGKAGHAAVKGYARRRIRYYSSLGKFAMYGDSWTDRTLDTLLEAVAA